MLPAFKKILPSVICLFALYACNGEPANTDAARTPNPSEAAAPAPPPPANHLRIMSYNVLKYGDDCQDEPQALHKELQTIVTNVSPDILGLVKVAAPDSLDNAAHAKAPAHFPDDVLRLALGAAFPNKYAMCPSSNHAGANNINLLFYNTAKLGFAGMQTLLSNETDFNLYKLYVKSSVAAGKDTTFLYILLNHTESGDEASSRDEQMGGVVTALHNTFRALPNLIDMGDFNMRSTREPGYQSLVSAKDAGFRFADPPFALDKVLQYPGDWEDDPEPYAKFLTTSTRKKDDKPNSCGTGGGAKFWYDHMLVSPPIAAGSAGLSYVKGSYKTIGNDGNRVGRSVFADKNPNTAVSPQMAEALFNFSNKYPVMLELSY